MKKIYKLKAKDIQPLATGLGACIATDRITVDGKSVRYMYREQPDNDIDSGWRFLSGDENEEYMNNPNNHSVFDVNTIANADPSIIPYLHADAGMAFEKPPGNDQFMAVKK